MLLDSCAWIEFFEGSETGLRVKDVLRSTECFTSIVSVAEITEWSLKNGFEVEEFIGTIRGSSTILILNNEISESAGKINFENKKSIKNWGMLDALIYATARFYGLTTLTKDNHFSELEDVEML